LLEKEIPIGARTGPKCFALIRIRGDLDPRLCAGRYLTNVGFDWRHVESCLEQAYRARVLQSLKSERNRQAVE